MLKQALDEKEHAKEQEERIRREERAKAAELEKERVKADSLRKREESAEMKRKYKEDMDKRVKEMHEVLYYNLFQNSKWPPSNQSENVSFMDV